MGFYIGFLYIYLKSDKFYLNKVSKSLEFEFLNVKTKTKQVRKGFRLSASKCDLGYWILYEKLFGIFERNFFWGGGFLSWEEFFGRNSLGGIF